MLLLSTARRQAGYEISGVSIVALLRLGLGGQRWLLRLGRDGRLGLVLYNHGVIQLGLLPRFLNGLALSAQASATPPSDVGGVQPALVAARNVEAD